ncbi:MAG: MOSC domain-containing protein [Acidobacteriota bacterium]|nr:MOSC domain-containing protein [Acidobacteriota bacterium]
MSVTVTALRTAAIKGTRLLNTEQIVLDERGAAGNRRFFVADERDRMRNGKQLGSLQSIVALLDDHRLRLEFPDGSAVEHEVELGEPVTTQFFSHQLVGRLVLGPFSQALSEHCGQPLRLLEAGSAVDRGAAGPVSLISRGSLRRIGEQAGTGPLDARRFRMLIEVDGVEPHAEDTWLGQRLRVGSAVLRFDGNVGRCLVTSRDPETGEMTLPTLDLLRAYRTGLQATEPLPFGIYGRVLRPGTVRVGDTIAPADG